MNSPQARLAKQRIAAIIGRRRDRGRRDGRHYCLMFRTVSHGRGIIPSHGSRDDRHDAIVIVV